MRFPETQRNCVLCVVSGDGCVVGSGHDGFSAFPDASFDSVIPDLLDESIESDLILYIQSLDFPWISLIEPEIGLFDLVAFLDELFEYSVGVPDAVSKGRIIECGK